jgi:hypothetical protein
MINAKNIPVDEVWSDPAADNTQGAINIDDAVILRGVRGRGGPQPPIRYLSDRFRSIEYGVEKVRFLLGDPSANMPVRVSFARTLAEKKFHRGIVRDLASLRYPDLKDGRPISNKPVKDGVTDHSTDACRYWAVGMVLTSPLRKMFYDLQSEKGGFRLASAA